jgi:hypothetical protein
MRKIPTEDRAFLLENKQVFFANGRSRWMTLNQIRKAVTAGRADDWHVIDINLDTGEWRIVCAYCAAGVTHYH